MAVLIDPPKWPGHGTTWSHLVSDFSLRELHAFAERNGVPRRAFDLDHYDVPKSSYDQLVTGGAIAVTGGELITRLKASGLRVHGSRRNKRLKLATFSNWMARFPDCLDIGWELAGRWNEPHRRYHGLTHLHQVLNALSQIVDPGEDTRSVELALWFHDAIYEGQAGTDEIASAQLASDLLGRYASGPHRWITPEEVSEVARLVLITADHQPDPCDRQGSLVSDADLSILGSAPAAYLVYCEAIRSEYVSFSDSDFRTGRASVLERLAAKPVLFRTERGASLWQAQTEINLAAELERL